MEYSINIYPKPETFNGKKMYFWMIQGESGDTHFNCGHGWSEGIAKAAEDANEYYQNVIKGEKNE